MIFSSLETVAKLFAVKDTCQFSTSISITKVANNVRLKNLLASTEKKKRKSVCSDLSEAVGHRGLQEALLKQTHT